MPTRGKSCCGEILRTTARQAFETLRLWTRPAARNLADIAEVHGEALFDEALRRGEGLIVAAPHMRQLGAAEPVAGQQDAAGDPVPATGIGGGRGLPAPRPRQCRRAACEQVRAEAAGVRTLLRRLQKGGVVGILPDQQPKAGEGEFAPFFGKQALTMTLLGRLAAPQRRAGAAVLVRAAAGPRRAALRPARARRRRRAWTLPIRRRRWPR